MFQIQEGSLRGGGPVPHGGAHLTAEFRANVPGGDEFNAALMEEYRDRIFYM